MLVRDRNYGDCKEQTDCHIAKMTSTRPPLTRKQLARRFSELVMKCAQREASAQERSKLDRYHALRREPQKENERFYWHGCCLIRLVTAETRKAQGDKWSMPRNRGSKYRMTCDSQA